MASLISRRGGGSLASYQLWWEGPRTFLDTEASREFHNPPSRTKTTAVQSVHPS